MKINRLYVTGYKNLVDCDIHPRDVHAITGCNSTGKSNFLEILPFVISLHTASDEGRAGILTKGFSPNGLWFPISKSAENLREFKFRIECILPIGQTHHVIEYELELKSTGAFNELFHQSNGATFARERITGKEQGKPGKAKTLLERDGTGAVTAYGGKTPRAENAFKCKSDMSALQALEVREADDFAKTYELLAAFRQAFLASSLIRLDTEKFRNQIYNANRPSFLGIHPGQVIDAYDPYSLLQEVKKDETNWKDFCHWLKRLVNIDDLVLYEWEKEPLSKDNLEQYIFPKQHGRLLISGELSMGSSVAIAILTSLFTLLQKGGVALFEEPENYLHPKAIEEIIRLFREFGSDHSVLFTTHSPVALNSMKPEEVTVMRPIDDEFVTTTSVKDIPEAMDAINRGYLTIGDLLQTNYTAD